MVISLCKKSNTVGSVEVRFSRVKLAVGRLVGNETGVMITLEILKISITVVNGGTVDRLKSF